MVCVQIKDEQGNFKTENFSELRHVAFNIKDQDGNVDGEKPAAPAARSAPVKTAVFTICILILILLPLCGQLSFESSFRAFNFHGTDVKSTLPYDSNTLYLTSRSLTLPLTSMLRHFMALPRKVMVNSISIIATCPLCTDQSDKLDGSTLRDPV